MVSVYREVLDLAVNWMDVGLVLGHDYLQRFWVFASPTVAPLLRRCMTCLQRMWKLASPSVSSTLRLLLALGWLLIVAGDVELNPGPVSQGELQ